MPEKPAALAVNLKRLRKERGGLSQRGLSTISGVSWRTIQNAEGNISGLGSDSLLALSKALQVSVDELLRGHAGKTPRELEMETKLQLVERILRAAPNELQAFVDLWKGLDGRRQK